MGDRTHVTLSVLRAQVTDVEAILGENLGDSFDAPGSDLVYFMFEEVNYGELPFLPELIEAGIAYESSWESGADFSAGTEHCRFTETGELQQLQVFVASVNPSLVDLLTLLDGPDPLEEIRGYLLQHKARVTPLPWENQVEYGKRYRARELIKPRSTSV